MSPRPTVWTLFAIVLALAIDAPLAADSLQEDSRAVTLPLEIEINGRSHGEVIVRASPSLEIVEIEGATLRELLADKVSSDLSAIVDSLPVGFASLQSYRELGLEIHLDLERLVIALQVQERHAADREGPRSIRLGHRRELNHDGHTPEARFSGYANLRLHSNFSERAGLESSSSHSLGISHVLNYQGFALEGESVWKDSRGFTTRELRLVKDLPHRLWRLRAGDVSTPINDLQRGFQVFGVNLGTEFGIQPYRTFTPTSSASFQLEEPATVSVTLNGRPARTMKLEPGSYNIEEFKLAAGSNRMELEIQTESGLVDRLDVSAFGSMNLLDAGVSDFSYTFGWPRSSAGAPDASKLSGSSWYERYVESEPIFSGYYKRGLSNQMTASLNAQGSMQWGRLGAGLYTASERFGSLNGSYSYNQSSRHSGGHSARLTWSKEISGYAFSLSSIAADRNFNLIKPEQTGSERDLRLSNSISVSKLFAESVNVSLSWLDQRRFDDSRLQTATLNVGRRFASLYASATLRHSRDFGRSETGGYLSLTWNPAPKWRARSQARYSDQAGGSSVSTLFDYSNRRANDYVNARLDARHSDTGYNYEGSLSYQSSLYRLGLSHSSLYNSIDGFVQGGDYTSLELESAVAFADGAVGFAHRIRNSFAIINKHPAWSDVKLGINPTLGGFEKNGASSRFSPVLPSLHSYREEYATVQTVDSSLFLERNDYYFYPGYRRGTLLTLGDDAIYSLRSTLSYSDGEAVKFKAIQLQHSDGEKVNTFTNGVGRFMATGLRPGTYTITTANSAESLVLEIVEGEPMIFIPQLFLATAALP